MKRNISGGDPQVGLVGCMIADAILTLADAIKTSKAPIILETQEQFFNRLDKLK